MSWLSRSPMNAPTRIQLSQGRVALVDVEFAGIVGQYTWHAYKGKATNAWYARTNTEDGGTLLLHRLVWELCGLGPVNEIDHQNRDGLDCRRQNLRPATASQNAHNRARQKNNTTGYKGVTRHKANRWRARIRVGDGKRLDLGLHPSPEQAARAYNRAALAHFGTFAALNDVPPSNDVVVTAPVDPARPN